MLHDIYAISESQATFRCLIELIAAHLETLTTDLDPMIYCVSVITGS